MGNRGPMSWLIRVTGAILALYCAAMAIAFVWCVFPALYNRATNLVWTLALVVLLGSFGVALSACAVIGFRMMWRVDRTAVENFSFIFALFMAIMLNHAFAGNKADYFFVSKEMILIVPYISFFLFYYLFKKCFLSLLKIPA